MVKATKKPLKAKGKAKAKAKAKAKPASMNIDAFLDSVEQETLEQKMERYRQSGASNIDGFLVALPKAQQEQLWKKFEYSRSQSPEQAKNYQLATTGPGTMVRKRNLLNAWILAKKDTSAKCYMEQLMHFTTRKSTESTEEWVSWEQIKNKYGEQEALKRMKKGSIRCRRDPHDDEFWQFHDVRVRASSVEEEEKSFHVKGISKIGSDKMVDFDNSFEQNTVGNPDVLPQGLVESLGVSRKSLKAIMGPTKDEEEDELDNMSTVPDKATAKVLSTKVKAMLSKVKAMEDKLDENEDEVLEPFKKKLKESNKKLSALTNPSKPAAKTALWAACKILKEIKQKQEE